MLIVYVFRMTSDSQDVVVVTQFYSRGGDDDLPPSSLRSLRSLTWWFQIKILYNFSTYICGSSSSGGSGNGSSGSREFFFIVILEV